MVYIYALLMRRRLYNALKLNISALMTYFKDVK